jgi:hypothetical protein
MKVVKIYYITDSEQPEQAINLMNELEGLGLTFIQNKGYVFDENDEELVEKIQALLFNKYLSYDEIIIHIKNCD